MKNRYRLVRRTYNVLYSFDQETDRTKSLRTTEEPKPKSFSSPKTNRSNSGSELR